MKAILFPSYGPPERLVLQTVAKPAPTAEQVLVKIVAAAANPADWHRMRADPWVVRLSDGLRKPKDPRLGADIAGRVEAVGAAVTRFKPGDEVFGEVGAGGFAEYLCVKESALAPKPASLSFAEVAAVPVAGLTALQGLRDHGKIQPGQQVLINGASGGVGTYAVQLAKYFGATVTAVCSTRNLELVRTLGADQVVDYTQTDFTRAGQRYDLILDAIGNYGVADYRRALTPQGRCAIAGFTSLTRLISVALLGTWGGQPAANFLAQPTQADLLVLKDLLETGKIISVIDRTYSLAQTAEAIRYLETGRARGKVIINVTASEPA
ncbi:MAG: NAD(P)-dependent alcohol dehydrogenase [Caldilineaceae bacterium]|nr:NAD(P)-dependent alcohol dehydrogenase [Caldilineaceae bacterium]